MAKMILYQGPGFTVRKPSDWLAVATEQYQAAFLGPMIGAARAGFFVAVSPATDQRPVGQLFADIKGEQQAALDSYRVVSEQERVHEDFSALSRNFTWYNAAVNMVIAERQLFMHANDFLYIVTSTQPNNEHMDEFDALFVDMFNSFRVQPLATPDPAT